MSRGSQDFIRRYVADHNTKFGDAKAASADLSNVFHSLYDDTWPAKADRPRGMRSGVAAEFEAMVEAIVARDGIQSRVAKAIRHAPRIPIDPVYYGRLATGEAELSKSKNSARVRLLIDNDFVAYMRHAFRFARESIDIFTPRFRASTRGIGNLIRHNAGVGNVKIRVLVTDLGGARSLRAIVPEKRLQLRILETTQRNHERLVIVDGEKYITGSHGFTPTSLFNSREISVAVEQSPDVCSAAAMRFEPLWSRGRPV